MKAYIQICTSCCVAYQSKLSAVCLQQIFLLDSNMPQTNVNCLFTHVLFTICSLEAPKISASCRRMLINYYFSFFLENKLQNQMTSEKKGVIQDLFQSSKKNPPAFCLEITLFIVYPRQIKVYNVLLQCKSKVKI